MKIPWLTLILGLIIVVLSALLIYSCEKDPIDNTTKKAYQDAVATLREEKVILRTTIDSISRATQDSIEKVLAVVRAQDREIDRLKKKSVRSVKAIPIEAHTQYPEIQIALQDKDSVIRATESKADSLQNVVYFQMKATQAYEIAVAQEERIEADMMQECEARVAELEELNERMRKKKKSLGEVLKEVGKDAGFFGLGFILGKAS